MLEAVIGWARERHSKRLGLWAPCASDTAISFYRNMGFRETANRDQLRAGSALQIVEMVHEL